MTHTVDAPDRPPAEELLGEARFAHRLARTLLRDAGLAQDVAQEALVAALQQPQPPRSMRAWLAAATRRLAKGLHRAERVRRRHEGLAARPEAGDGERRTQAQLVLHRQLCDALLTLPEPYRTAVTLRYLEDLPPRAIARRQRRNVEIVRQHIHRGLAMLRQRLDREFGDRSGWMAAFSACGFGGTGATATSLLSVLIMKKAMLAAGALLVACVWWISRGDAEPALPVVAAPGRWAPAPAVPPSAQRPADAAPVRTVVESLPRAEQSFGVQVVDDEARPLRDVTVRCWREQGEADVRRTGGDGRVEFAASDDGGALRIEAEARPPQLLQIEQLLGERQVVLPRGVELSGQVLVDGVPAPAGLRLRLTMPFQALPANLPFEAARWLQDHAWRQCETRTQDGGIFAFLGLAADWQGKMQLPSPYWWVPGQGMETIADERWLHLTSPGTGIVVTATQLPTIRGTVVWDDTGEPAGGALVACFVHFTDEETSPLEDVEAQADGSFAIGVSAPSSSMRERWYDPSKRPPITSAKLWGEAPGSDGSTEVALDSDQLRQPVRMRLRRAAVTHFLAQSERGMPISGAVVVTGGSNFSEPTGADGRGHFLGPRDKALIGAPGFRVGPCAAKASGTADDPLVLVLCRDSTLRLRLRAVDQSVPPGCSLQLCSKGLLLDGQAVPSALVHRFGGSRAGGGARFKRLPDGTKVYEEVTLDLDVDERGEAVMHSLLPDLPAVLKVWGRGTLLLEQDITTPSVGETKVVDLIIRARPRQLRGRVLGPDGLPLVSARVECEGAPLQGLERTAADGTFAFHDLYSDSILRLVARKPGFAPQAIGGLTRDRDGQPIAFQLQPGHQVHVTVRDEAARIVPVRVRVDAADLDQEQKQELQPGDWRFQDLPSGTVTLWCEFGGQRFELRHDTREAEAVLRVPTPAEVEVTATPGFPAPADGFHLVAIATRLDAGAAPVELKLLGAHSGPQFLLPGRYRIALVAQRWHDDGPERRLLGPAAEVELHAGDNKDVPLR